MLRVGGDPVEVPGAPLMRRESIKLLRLFPPVERGTVLAVAVPAVPGVRGGPSIERGGGVLGLSPGWKRELVALCGDEYSENVGNEPIER